MGGRLLTTLHAITFIPELIASRSNGNQIVQVFLIINKIKSALWLILFSLGEGIEPSLTTLTA